MDRGEWERVVYRLPDIVDTQSLGPLRDFWLDAIEVDHGPGMPKELAISYYWSLRLMCAMDERRDSLEIPGYRFTAFGFLIDPEGEDPNFGVQHYAVLAEDEKEDEEEAEEEAEEEDEEEEEEDEEEDEEEGNLVLLDPITVGNQRFPVVVRRVKEAFHAPTVHPQWGSGGCWGTSRKGSNNPCGPGVVTAKHVITHNVGSAPRLGDQIRLSDGSQATILDLGPDGIDVGLISTPEPPGNIRFSMKQHLAPYTRVTFEGVASRAHSTWIMSITDVRGVTSSLLPARAILADAGLGGDSGALVWDSNYRT